MSNEPSNGGPDHNQLRRELERSAQLMRASLAHRHRSTRLAVIVLLAAGVLGTIVTVILLVAGSGEVRPASPPHAASQPAPTHPATSPPPRETPRPEEATVHTVARGDTLARIALRYRAPMERIAADNNLADPNRISPGQRLVIGPAPPGVEVIAPGSTLTDYGHRHGLSIAKLLALNPHITNPDRIRAGGQLRVAP